MLRPAMFLDSSEVEVIYDQCPLLHLVVMVVPEALLVSGCLNFEHVCGNLRSSLYGPLTVVPGCRARSWSFEVTVKRSTTLELSLVCS